MYMVYVDGVYGYHDKYPLGKIYLNVEDFMGAPVLLLKSKTTWDPILDIKSFQTSCMQCFLTKVTCVVLL